MKVKLDKLEHELLISWHHDRVDRVSREGEITERDRTICRAKFNGEIIEEAEAICFYKDPPNRKRARKITLQRLVIKLTERFQLTKQERKLFWESYKEMTNGAFA